MNSEASTPVGADVAFESALPSSQDDIVLLVAALLDEDPQDIDPDENLIECGIDSIGVMRIVDSWSRQGVSVRYAELFERPTVTGWWLLLSERISEIRHPGDGVEVDISAPFELSPIQHAYWVGRGDDQPLGGIGCHVYLEVDGAGVDRDRLDQAVRAVAERHPMLRVRVHGDGTQQIGDRPTWPGLRVHDLRESTVLAADLAAIRETLSHRRLEVERGEVFDVQLSLLPSGATRLHIELDLLVADVLSFNVFLNDLALAYRDGPAALRPLSYSYPGYCADLATLRAHEVDGDRRYWAERLAELPAAPQLPLAVEPELVGRPTFRRIARWIEPSRYRRLVERARAEQVTVAMTLATVFADVLGRWSGMSRLLLNVPVFDRRTLHPDVPELIADFTNLVLLEVDLGGADLVERVRSTQRRFQTDISHIAYSGVEVLRDLARRGDHAGAPVVFAANLSSGDLLSTEFRESFGELGFMISQTPQVWLDHQLMEMDGGLYLNWDYVDGLCAEGVVPAMFEAYLDVVDRLINDGWDAAHIPLPEDQAAVRSAIGTPTRVESGRLLHGAFFERAVREPDRVALLWGVGGELSYGGLADWALRVAGELVACGVRSGDAVAVSLPKGPGQVAAILGVLAAGGVYVPCGVDQPVVRRERMFAAAGVRFVVGEGGGVWPEGVRVVGLDCLSAAPLSGPVAVADSASAYVIFTSGSTGVPKGVEVSHRAAVNTVEDVNERFVVGPEDRVLAVSAADFDLSVYDMFGLLGVGGAVVLVEESDRREARRWVELCVRYGVTVWNSVPALFDMYLTVVEAGQVADRIRLVLVSGDWVGLDLPGRFRARGAGGRFVALGGATEAAIWSNAFEVDSVDPRWRSIPYGFALSNQCYRVVDAVGRDCPDWVAGELWIGGVGVAQGYRGDPEKTAEKFVSWQGRRWYRTGDLGRFWPDGTLEFLGRSDLQVKVRGHRIELGEIEAVLEAHPHIERAVATTIGTGTNRKLAATVTTDPSIDLAAVDVRRWLDERLPGHMVPEQFAVLDELPLTSNGKVDRAAVAAGPWWTEEEGEDQAAPPQGRMEELLGDLWLEFLSVERVNRTDNFFRCGGDSLIGTRLVARLGSLGVEGAELRGLFANPTLAGFAATLEFGATSAARFVAEPDARHDPFPVTDVQQAYLLGRRTEFTLGGVGCHFYVEFDNEDVDVARLEQAWNTLIARHDMLRAVFDETGQQRVLATVPGFTIPVTEVAADEAEPALARLRTEMSHRLFDPAQWPLFDVRAVRYGQRVRLGVGLDNLVLDALSVLILFTELNLLYDDPQAVLRPVDVTFRDYQLNTRPDPGELAAAREYWSSRLDRLPPAPDLPLAVDPVHITAPRFLRRQLHLDREHWGVITKRAREHEITPSALLLACYAEVLGAWSGRPDMTLTLTTFRRQEVHPDINNILGDFTSLLLVAYEPEPGTGLAARARALQEQMWRDLDHQAVSATWVLREMARRAGLAETSMPVVFTSALGVLDGLDTTAAADFAWGISQTPQVWLDHQVREYADGLAVNWDHVEGLFPPGVIDQMFGAYQAALDWLATGDWSAPLPVSGPVRDIAPVSRVESGRLLHGAFFERAVREPDRVALLWGVGGELSYGGLADWALRVAGELVACGVRSGDAVAVSLPKGPGQVAAILGVLAAGGVYVPCGVDQPVVRRERMFAAAGVRFVVGEGGGVWPEGVRVVGLDCLSAAPLSGPVAVADSASAYVIFTSGSTGVPKGVEVSHRAAVNTVEDVNERFVVGPEDRVLAVSAADFDLSVYDMFGLLGVGGAVVLVEESDRREARRWVELCVRYGVTVWNSVPALFDMYLTVVEAGQVADRIRLVLVSGDWVGLDLPGRFRARGAGGRFVALGGATEAAIWSNAFEVDSVDPRWRSIPYGFALSNQCYRVVDAVGRDCPDWVAGELWIGGVGVAQGYRGDPEKTAEKFVSWQGRRWYRTGDLGRFWPDGTLEFLGRSDLQVKVRGHRIELGEIEAVLEAHPHIERAVATTIGTGTNRKLAATVTVARQGAVAVTDGIAALDLPHDDQPVITVATDGGLEATIVESRITALIAKGIGSQPATPDDIATALGLDDNFRDLLRLWLDWLTERAVLTARSGRYGVGERWAEVCDPRTWLATTAAADGPLHAVALRLAAVEHEIAEILRGERSPLMLLEDPVLSPEALVAVQPDTEAAIDWVARTITKLAAALGRPIRIADLGCRTGVAAQRLLARVDGDQVEATLLDTSPRLLELAAARLEHAPHAPQLRTVTDTSVPPDLRHAFDVVMMTGALHRYGDPVDGAAQAGELLAPRGVLIGLEHRELAPVALLTAAVLERGFGGSRRGPMLDAEGWTEVLAAAHLQEIGVHEQNSALLLLTARSAADRPVVREDEVLADLRRELPAHMVPERLVALSRLPLSANGKVDRARVAELLARTDDGGDSSEPPRTDIERLITQLWGELLAVTVPGRLANFFALGGDSLTATQFAEALLARYGVTLPLRQMFAEPTVAAVADAVSAQLDDSTEEGVL